ncbi:hypothetical protein L6164_024111 [Bauhinia variegata]|uniref:Uncharacterized protein n=1 Tax=Bauhinia variegata TaxID=167791 RepID=A0ACB9LY12_BAUVA|nr:hypothetical protein L6164_024111 [Bauhinia variegata]
MEAPEFFQNSFSSQFPYDNKPTTAPPVGVSDNFIVEDLLDFPNDDAIIADGALDSVPSNSVDSSLTAVDSCINSPAFSGCNTNFVGDIGCQNFPDGHFSGDLCVPYDDAAELEWLSNFVEESFSSEDLQKLQLISGMKARTDEVSESREFQPEPNRNNPIFNREVSVPAKARSKRSRGPPCNWTSRLLVLSPTTSPSEHDVIIPTPGKKAGKPAPRKKESSDGSGGDGRKCLHCATDKTPQWRTGPMGPKTLCNACGVRYKSGRLVPEYRPAASPTFVLTKHSNSHRKVLELRRQKEMMGAHQQQQQQQHFLQQQNMMFDMPNGDDYLIHQHLGPDFRQLI